MAIESSEMAFKVAVVLHDQSVRIAHPVEMAALIETLFGDQLAKDATPTHEIEITRTDDGRYRLGTPHPMPIHLSSVAATCPNSPWKPSCGNW